MSEWLVVGLIRKEKTGQTAAQLKNGSLDRSWFEEAFIKEFLLLLVDHSD
jgi:hypothetical protein